MAKPFNPYSSAQPYFGGMTIPNGLQGADADRVRSYQLYEQMYWNHPETFQILQRGEDQAPIYLPSAKTIIEATNRFLAVNFSYIVAPNYGTPADQQALDLLFRRLFRRERIWSKVAAQKRFGLIRGDTIWHITANPAKPQGSRLTVRDVHPSRYFQILDPDDSDRIIGVHLVDETVHPKDPNKRVTRRQTYRKKDDGSITTELTLWEIGKWDDRPLKPNLKIVQVVVPETQLPPVIDVIPVYHIKNTWDSGSQYGSSTIRGIETILNAANQATSDQDLALAMAGLGVYATDAAPPVDAEGIATDWEMGPNRVAEVPPGKFFNRVSGVGSVDPSLNHIKFILGEAQAGAAVPDIAAGKVDVAIATSGIALRLHLAPILASNADKEGDMLGVYDQMFFDIAAKWFAAYEGFSAGATVEVNSIVGDPLPVDRAAAVQEIVSLYTAKIIDLSTCHAELAKIGYKFPNGTVDAVIAEAQKLAEATSFDPFANRSAEELAGLASTTGVNPAAAPPQTTTVPALPGVPVPVGP